MSRMKGERKKKRRGQNRPKKKKTKGGSQHNTFKLLYLAMVGVEKWRVILRRRIGRKDHSL